MAGIERRDENDVVARGVERPVGLVRQPGLPERGSGLQREVAERLIAKPGTKEYGVLSVRLQHVAGVEMLLKLPAGAFRPAPKVLSALVRLRFHAANPPVADAATLAALVQAVFTRRRKTLANALQAYRSREPMVISAALAEVGVDGRRRPETLTVAEFARLADFYAR